MSDIYWHLRTVPRISKLTNTDKTVTNVVIVVKITHLYYFANECQGFALLLFSTSHAKFKSSQRQIDAGSRITPPPCRVALKVDRRLKNAFKEKNPFPSHLMRTEHS